MKFIALLLTLSASAFVSISASAAGIHSCDGLDSIGGLIATKTVDNVKLAYVSTEEPAAAPDHLLVFIYGAEMSQTCTAISLNSQGSGFGYVNLSSLKSVSYNSEKGRLFEITVYEPSYDGTQGKPAQIRFRTNSVTGKVSLEN